MFILFGYVISQNYSTSPFKKFNCFILASNPAVAAATSAAYANLVEAHNNYVQQLHAANGMVDQYYSTTLPQLLQELDDVYQDVSAVVAETIVQGADVISMKVGHF